MIPSELESKIQQLHRGEHWPVGSIARHLNVHHSVVRRALGYVPSDESKRAQETMITPYRPFILETLAKYPDICASRIYQMIKARGFEGSEGHLRRVMAQGIRKREPSREAFLKLHMLPGSQAQVDWADFGKITIGRAVRRLSAFVMVLSYSRYLFFRFFLSMKMREFMQGFKDAFDFFGGVPREILHDNLKSGVIERVGSIIKFNDRFLTLSGHYGFEPSAANIRRGNEKGRVERSIQYIRTGFFPGRDWKSVEDLNSQALDWCLTEASNRKWADDTSQTVGNAFDEEKTKLMPLPATAFPADERALVSIGKTPYARFDLNDYSVPPQFVRSTLQVRATDNEVEVLNGIDVVATHKRSFDKHTLIENPEHIKAITERKKRGRKPSALRKLVTLIPETQPFLEGLALKNQNLGGAITVLMKYLATHGEARLRIALKEAVAAEFFRLQAIAFILARLDAQENQLPPVPIEFKSKHGFENIVINHHDLKNYDEMMGIKKYDK